MTGFGFLRRIGWFGSRIQKRTASGVAFPQRCQRLRYRQHRLDAVERVQVTEGDGASRSGSLVQNVGPEDQGPSWLRALFRVVQKTAQFSDHHVLDWWVPPPPTRMPNPASCSPLAWHMNHPMDLELAAVAAPSKAIESCAAPMVISNPMMYSSKRSSNGPADNIVSPEGGPPAAPWWLKVDRR